MQLEHYANEQKAWPGHLEVDVDGLQLQGFWKLLGTLVSSDEDDTLCL